MAASEQVLRLLEDAAKRAQSAEAAAYQRDRAFSVHAEQIIPARGSQRGRKSENEGREDPGLRAFLGDEAYSLAR